MAKVSPESRGLAIIVMGVSGSGKSTVGSRLADCLACPYLEGDELHLPGSIDKMAAGIPLDDEDRWPWLARLSNGIDRSVAQHDYVVATCSALKRKYRDRLRQQIRGPVVFIHLVAERTSLELRMASRNKHYMPVSLLQSQLQSLEPPAGDENALVLTNDTDITGVVSFAYAWVHSLDSIGCGQKFIPNAP